MPEYLAPGVYVEEVSFRSKSIEGVSTTTTGFIGPTRSGPIDLEPDILTSLGDFERVYGDGQPLQFADGSTLTNFVHHAVRGFFEEGGKRLYICRVFLGAGDATPAGQSRDGSAERRLPGTAAAVDDETEPAAQFPNDVIVRARFPGALGNLRLRLTLTLGQNLLGQERVTDPVTGLPAQVNTLRALQEYDVVWIGDFGSPLGSALGSPLGSPLGAGGAFYSARREDDGAGGFEWFFHDAAGARQLRLRDLLYDADPTRTDQVRAVTLTVLVYPTEIDGQPDVWGAIPLDPRHRRPDGALDALDALFAVYPANRAMAYRLPISVQLGEGLSNGLSVLNALLAASVSTSLPAGIVAALTNPASTDAQRSFEVTLAGGNDGLRPTATEYEGDDNQDRRVKTGLKAFEDIEDISIVAAPGSTFGYENSYNSQARTIMALLINHATRMRYRIAVLDAGDNQTIAQVRALRAQIDSKYAALYYPWVRILDPITRAEINLPPSGFIAGIYARNDINRSVVKAPANEVVNLALGFELLINKAQQDILNPEGINCLRFFEGRGYLVWGARTVSSDPEWKYVNLRRYFAYLERSIDRGTQWAVFEPNGEALWANVRRTVEDFLFNEWSNGALLGDKPEKAYFVRCDRSTMTQNDLDNGRLICLIGVAPLRPAEFVIFRIGQWTADVRR